MRQSPVAKKQEGQMSESKPVRKPMSTKVSELYGSRYTSAESWEGDARQCEVIGAGVEVTGGFDGQDRRPKIVLDLEGVEKPVVINATNAEILSAEWGDDAADWIGRVAEIGIHKVPFQGRKVDGLYLKPIK
jgi:hypothetical protein